MKKTICIIMCLALALSLCACGNMYSGETEQTATESTEVQTGEYTEEEPIGVGVVNPLSELTAEELLNATGIDFGYISEYDDAVVYTVIDGDPIVAQADFTLNGDSYNYRAAPAAEETDISGMYYYSWTITETEVAYCTATVRVTDEGQGVISWFDAAPGVMYTLSMSENADAEKLESTANMLFMPTQGDSDGDFTGIFMSMLPTLHEECEIGTAGSSLVLASYAAQLADMFTEYQASAEDAAGMTAEYCGDALADAEDKALFVQQLGSLRGNFEALCTDGVEVLNDTEYAPVSYPWDEDAIGAIFDAMYNAVSSNIYAPILENYYTAIAESWDQETLMDAGMNYMVADCGGLDCVGYLIADIDGDDTLELLIGAIADDDFLRDLVFDLYTVNDYGETELVFTSWERNRYYSVGEGLFSHVGSSSADDSFDTTEQYAAGVMLDLGYATETSTETLNLSPFSAFKDI